MIFHKLLSVLDGARAVDILTVIDSTPHNDKCMGQMMIMHADGMVEGQFNKDVVQQILLKVRAIHPANPVVKC